ncbi:Aminopeptidase N [Eumeta japonica]|uniref:Aminopeptidase n=1 Tax=Eumeta variegata TaxID=151549 RepID=A0A4C1VXV8_EUMVA|nr:Aminopeptidase N [Eumeta japonica]
MHVKCLRPTDKVILHGQNFKVYKEKVAVRGDSGNLVVTEATINDTFNFLTLYLDKSLESDKNYTLTIPFYGNLDNSLNGAYISSYKNMKTGTKEYLVSTQFEAISARKALPCFDEPEYKASFRVSIGHRSDLYATSNMPIVSSMTENQLENFWTWTEIQQRFKKDENQFIWDKFENSVPMSTYLLAFVVSKFAHVESPPELSKTKFRIWARSDAINQTDYASKIGPKVLTNFENWFNVSFPLPKQDMFAIPDFSSGAMENWGLITYRETALLYDEKQSSFTAKERVASVVAHELAHQWFGNLVTMKWWSDLWLNEGFATYVGSLGVEKVEPTWGHANYEAADNMRRVLVFDGLESSHPVSVPIENPDKIQEIFDAISYSKGSLLIRMMVTFLGEETFRKGLTSYLIKHSYKNAEQDDLWEELTAAASESGRLPRDVTVKDIMDTWTKQTGYPMLTVTRDYANRSMDITQKRFLSLVGSANTSESWWVPLNIIHQGDSDQNKPIKWMSNKEGTTSSYRLDHGAENNQWILFNSDLVALYRVNYDPTNWQLLADTLNSDSYGSIPSLGRAQLLTDAFALAWSNVIDYKTALQIGNYLQRETDHIPLESGLEGLGKINRVLMRTSDYGAFQKFMRKLISKTYERSGGLYAKRILNGDNLMSVKMQYFRWANKMRAIREYVFTITHGHSYLQNSHQCIISAFGGNKISNCVGKELMKGFGPGSDRRGVLISNWACRMRVPGCEDNAVELFKRWMNTPDPDTNNPIPLDLRSTVYCVGARRGGIGEWRFLFERYARSNVAAARTAAMLALACTNEVWLLEQYLEWTIGSGAEVRRQDAATVIAAVARQPVGFYLARDFLYHRIEEIFKAFNGQDRRLGGLVKVVAGQLKTQQELDEFITWSEKNSKYLKESRLSVAQAVENARVNIAWLERHRRPVVALLREHAQ